MAWFQPHEDFAYKKIGNTHSLKGKSQVTNHEPYTLVDKLIIGAYIEARSCERFAKLAPHLDEDLGKFYISLLRSEARHYQDYLSLAQLISKEDITERVIYFGRIEAELIQTPDHDFKFHSGVPIIENR